jgi:hypothetical protein
MRAFRNENPNAQFTDFVSRYSSAQFSDWNECWDEIDELECLLEYLRRITPLDLIRECVPVAFAAAYFAIGKLVNAEIAAAKEAFAEIERELEMFRLVVEAPSGTVTLTEFHRAGWKVANGIEKAAFVIDCQNSLLKKLSGCLSGVTKLNSGEGFLVSDNSERGAVIEMFAELNLNFHDHIVTREVVLTGEMMSGNHEMMDQQLYVGNFSQGTVIASIVEERF